jgi:hypothetical protein
MMEVPQEKFILDATAGFRMMWFNKQHPNCLYIDSRPECEPDEIQDFRKLPYPNETFRLIVWDPPHLLDKTGTTDLTIKRYFGGLCPETWQDDLKQGFAEVWRVLKPFGVLNLKWSTLQIPSDKLIKLFPIEPLFYQISSKREKRENGKRVRKDITLWFCFMKIPPISLLTHQSSEARP